MSTDTEPCHKKPCKGTVRWHKPTLQPDGSWLYLFPKKEKKP